MRYREWLRFRACDRKRLAYGTRQLAETAATLLMWAGKPRTRAYECDYCAAWHVSTSDDQKPEPDSLTDIQRRGP